MSMTTGHHDAGNLRERLAQLRQVTPDGNGHAGPGQATRDGPAPATYRADGPSDQAPDTRVAAGRVAVDWGMVREWRQQAADQLTRVVAGGDRLADDERRRLAVTIVTRLLDDYNDDEQRAGRPPLAPAQLRAHVRAVLDSLPPGLGRMQALVDADDIENIEINGHDNVRLVYADGTTRLGEPVADSDEELVGDLQFIAAHAGTSERPFSPANWALHLTLPNGSRLAATAWTSRRPQVVIRRHRLVEITLDDLVGLGSLSAECAELLAAAVRANKSIIVSGAQGHGKTTLVRALLAAIDPDERFGTIETEYELFADRLPGRRHNVPAWEGRPGSGERGPGGTAAGEVGLDELIYTALRMNLARIIVGEVRGKEVLAMFKAMQVGHGSISTIHARHARAVVERLVSLAVEAGNHVETFAYRQIAEHIDLIVHVQLLDDRRHGGSRRRVVAEVLAVEPGEGGRPALTEIYAPGPDGHATLRGCPAHLLHDLRAAGFGGFAEAGVGWGG